MTRSRLSRLADVACWSVILAAGAWLLWNIARLYWH